MIKLNLGSGPRPMEGYENIDIKDGKTAFPLPYADGSVDEVRACHLLEHFSEHEAPKVMDEWVRVLKQGGVLKVAVPDFEWVTQQYGAVADAERQMYLRAFIMGGQTDEHDVHNSAWTEGKLRHLMDSIGLTDIKRWPSDHEDCSALPVSLNLQGTKMAANQVSLKIAAIMSLPRLIFSANVGCIFASFGALGIRVVTRTGAFWGQCLTQGMVDALKTGVDLIFTIDYDTVFSKADVEYMIGVMVEHPEFDCVTGVQVKRHDGHYLFTLRNPDDSLRDMVAHDELRSEFVKVGSAAFGLTCFRASRLHDLPKPWFVGHPGEKGDWGADKIDEDMWFWKQWRDNGRNLYLCNQVRLGHIEEYINWPGADWNVFAASMHDYRTSGKPEGAKWDAK